MRTVSWIGTKTETTPFIYGYIFCSVCFQESIDYRRIANEVLSNQHGYAAQFIEMVKVVTQNEVCKGLFLTVVFLSYSDEK